MKLTIVITVYNEKSTILEAIEQAKALEIEKQIIIVDNYSTDGTREILKKINDNSLEIVYQPKNYGYGMSVITGMRLAKGEYMYVHNSDLEYDPRCVYEMLELAEKEKLDAIFGSRLLKRKGESKFKIIVDRPFYLGTIITTSLNNLFYRKNFTDIIGNRFYRTNALRAINPEATGISFDFEVVSKICKYSFKVKEIAVDYYPRTKGKKVKATDIIPAVITTLKVRFFNKKKIKNILAIRTDRFGEFILTLPAIFALKENFSQSRLTIMAHPYSAQLIQGNKTIDEILEYDDGRDRGILPTAQIINEIRKHKFDLAVIFNPKKKFHLITFLAGIPIRVGYDRKWGVLLNKKIKDLKSLGIKHEIDYNFDLVKTIGVKSDNRLPSIFIDKPDEARAARLLAEGGITNKSEFIIIHPWTSDSVKQWPIHNFIELAEKIVQETNLSVVIIGGKEEAIKNQKYFTNLNNGIIDLIGKTSLKELAGLLKKTKLLISGDSGPVHLACCVDIPVIAIFRSDIPGKSVTRWGPKSKGSIVIEKNNLDDITVAEVLDQVRSVIR